LRSGEVKSMTQDDSVVQWMVEAGHLDAESARAHPSKNQLFAALGMSDQIEPKTSNGATELVDGDAFLLCTDGWWNCLSDADIAATLAGSKSAETWLDRMTRFIAKRGGHKRDNFSAAHQFERHRRYRSRGFRGGRLRGLRPAYYGGESAFSLPRRDGGPASSVRDRPE